MPASLRRSPPYLRAMRKLPPASLYRLRTLASAGPRFYRTTAYMRRLEVLDLIVATGRSDPETGNHEYAITDAGRAELAERDWLGPVVK